ncbi:hypothetical protein E3N88_13876 [Mikania micrantha]|uniref:Uncharacterized protein n=1 Tax=Mikania micrantha TaxID=192012 RepID=A0A5N6P2G5_9ASTR|nr:hypothetical protein E3N88_13876 [Mikania micrantha]
MVTCNERQEDDGHCGVFRFGEQPQKDPEGCRSDPILLDLHADPIQEELIKITEVGNLIEIDVTGFKEQIEAIIGGEVKKFRGNKQMEWDYVNAHGRLGGILSIWDPVVFSKLGVTKEANFLHRKVARISDGWNDFTCMNSDGTTFSKIDRTSVSDRFYQRWPGAMLMAHTRKWFDYSIITLVTASVDYVPSPFKVYTSWLNIQGIDNVVVKAVWINARKHLGNGQLVKLNEERNKYEVLAELGFLPNQEKERVIKGEVGNGNSVSFWLDTWAGNKPLAETFPALFRLDQQKSSCVSERMQLVDQSYIFTWNWTSISNSAAEVEELE